MEIVCIIFYFCKLHRHVLNRSRAIENGCFVFSAAQCGTHTKGRKTFGHSLIINPNGEILQEKNDNQPGIIYEIIDLNQVEQQRERIPSLKNSKEFELVEIDASKSNSF